MFERRMLNSQLDEIQKKGKIIYPNIMNTSDCDNLSSSVNKKNFKLNMNNNRTPWIIVSYIGQSQTLTFLESSFIRTYSVKRELSQWYVLSDTIIGWHTQATSKCLLYQCYNNTYLPLKNNNFFLRKLKVWTWFNFSETISLVYILITF